MNVRIVLMPLEWRVWPWYRPIADPRRIWIGPLLIEWWNG